MRNLFVSYALVLILNPGSTHAADSLVIQGTCSAIKGNPSKKVAIRGVGGFSVYDDGFIMKDLTCPGGLNQLDGNMIVLNMETSSLEPKYSVQFFEAQRKGLPALFQIIAEGVLTCRPVHLRSNGVEGNGFGPFGRIPCKLDLEAIRSFRQLR